MATELPDRARVVIIGGGVIGTSVAYHLTKLGLTDVVLLEQGQLSSGTTWHAAGLVGQLRASESATRLVQYSTQLYAELEDETGLSAGYKQCGGVTVARTEDRMIQLRRTAANAAAFDMECELLSPEQALEHYPGDAGRRPGRRHLAACRRQGQPDRPDVRAGQGRADARRPRRREDQGHSAFSPEDGRATGVRTDAGDIEAEIVVNCAGQWAKQVGAMAGVNVPLHSAEHFYVVTEDIDGVHPDLPILRDPDGYTYFKEEVGGLVIGGFEPEAKPWVSPDDIPYPFEFQLLDEDWDHFEILMNNALLRIPALEATGIKKFYNGPESFTPDNQFILGEAPELDNYFVGAGFNSVGIATAGGAGRALAEWIVNGAPDQRPHRRRHPPLRAVQRQQPLAARPRRRGARPALRNPLAQPGDEDRATVPALAACTTCWRPPTPTSAAEMGWERANFFAPAGADPAIEYTWGKPNWLPWSAAEQTNTRNAVTVFDQTSFSKYLMVGPDAEAALQWLCTADVGRRGRQGRLHRNAQRARHLRVRRHRDPHRRRRVLHRQQCRHHRARQGPHPAKPARRHPRVAGRRDVGVRRFRRDGPEFARPAVHLDRRPTCPTRRSRSAPASRSRWDMRPCGRPGSPTSANWVGSSTCPPNSRSVCTRT